MRRNLALVMAVVALVAASCGGGSDDVAELQAGDLPAPSDDSGAAPAAALTPDIGVERYLLAAAEQSAQVDSMRFSMEMAMGGLADMGGQVVVITVSGAVADEGTRGEVVMDMSSMLDASGAGFGGDELAAVFGEPIEMRYDGDRAYMSSSFISWLVPVDTPWVTFAAEGDAAEMGVAADQIDPDDLLVILRGLGDDAEVVGSEEVDGVETTHIRGRFSANNLLDASGELDDLDEVLSGLDPTGSAAFDAAVFDVEVWIGDDGIVRRLRFGVDDFAGLDPSAAPGASMTMTMELSAIGEPVEIQIPGADEVTDLDDLVMTDLFG